jgi:hypothetical protein
MARNVKGSALVLGDVIQDQTKTGDTHPYLVVATSQFQIVLRNCTSHETSALTLVKIAKGDKTGDEVWSGKDSYVVKSGNTTDLNVYDIVTVETGQVAMQRVPSGPPVLMQVMGPYGPCFTWAQPTQVVAVPVLANRYADITYRVLGGVVSGRMETLLTELSS